MQGDKSSKYTYFGYTINKICTSFLKGNLSGEQAYCRDSYDNRKGLRLVPSFPHR